MSPGAASARLRPMTKTAAQPTHAAPLLELSSGHVLSRSLQVVAELGVADVLGDAPLTAADLAAAGGWNADALHRVLRVLESQGIFRLDARRRWVQHPEVTTAEVRRPRLAARLRAHERVRIRLGVLHRAPAQHRDRTAGRVPTGSTRTVGVSGGSSRAGGSLPAGHGGREPRRRRSSHGRARLHRASAVRRRCRRLATPSEVQVAVWVRAREVSRSAE